MDDRTIVALVSLVASIAVAILAPNYFTYFVAALTIVLNWWTTGYVKKLMEKKPKLPLYVEILITIFWLLVAFLAIVLMTYIFVHFIPVL